MKFFIPLIFITLLFVTISIAQRTPPPVPHTPPKPPEKVATPKPMFEYTYQSYANDPLQTRIYTLSNGFKVYMSVNKAEPRIQTYIAVKAGSKNDPSDATGLAHYLEHMLFKGTDKFGTTNYEIEKPLLEKIYNLFEDYRATTDSLKREKIYTLIDSISGEAAKIAIANEYDKMLASIGAKGTNAHTSFEETVYQNDIPTNQLENLLKIESERFRKPIMRIFHTELEAVYEEKNISLDNDNVKIWENLLSLLFLKHPYGTQTTIGTIEHLKNPSLKRIEDFLKRYYTPNNMALCMSGDFDPEATILMVDKYFGKLPIAPLMEKIPVVVEPHIESPRIKEVFGPDAESVNIGYRFGSNGTIDADMIALVSKILYNQTAGLIDLDLNQAQKVLKANAEYITLNESTLLFLSANVKEGQKLEEAKDLLLAEIEKIKHGEFPEWLIPAVINDYKLKQTKDFESNIYRASFLYNSFISNTTYDYSVKIFERLSQIKKEQLVDFVKKNFNSNYVVVYKKTGESKIVTKVTKPKITPVETNANLHSNFLQEITSTPVREIEPQFVDYVSALQQFTINANVPLWYVRNSVNNLFTLDYVFDFGTDSNKKLKLALDYLKLMGTSKLSAAQVNEAFFKISCNFETKINSEYTIISLTGLSENFKQAVELLEMLLSDCQSSNLSFTNLLSAYSKARNDSKLDKNVIFQQAMLNYGYYEKNSPFAHVLTNDELEDIKENELVDILKSMKTYKHQLWYYGKLDSQLLVSQLNGLHQTQKTLREPPQAKNVEQIPTTENKIFACDYDMKQTEVMMLSKQNVFDKSEIPQIKLFQEYFGGGMQSVMFQTLRESKALAYSVYSRYVVPSRKELSYYTLSYIGTQSDKLPEALSGMHLLFDSLPKIDANFESAKKSILQKIRSERIKPSLYAINFYLAKKLGIDYDIRKDVFETVPKIKFDDINRFHQLHFKNKTYTTLMISKKENIKPDSLMNYGKVQWLPLHEIFGY